MDRAPVAEVSQPSVPSAGRILGATVGALVVATILLVTTILPAEYGIDLLGVGRLLRLVDLAAARAGVVAAEPGEYRTDARDFILGPFQAVEYKYRIEKGRSMLFSWTATGQVRSDLHSEPDGAPQGYAESFEQREGTDGHGHYTAPFGGIHGWYWENIDSKEVTITLATAGFYSESIEFFGGGRTAHAVRDPRGHVVPRSSR
jgi:hypothetical protein